MRNHSTFLGMTRIEAAVLMFVSVVLAAILTPELSSLTNGFGGLSNRPICSANIRSIIQGMYIYANSNGGAFPCVAVPGHNFINGIDPNGAPAADGRYNKVTNFMDFVRPASAAIKQTAGSPLACLWLLVLDEQLSPKCFLCPSDPTATEPSDEIVLSYGPTTRYYLNFGMGDHGPLPFGHGESYSIAYPWVGGKPAPWWNSKLSDNDASATPLVSDMAPMQDPHAPGRKARDVTQALSNTYGNYIFNSGNHNGDGQNVGYADDHVTWCTNPYVGVNNDNIFTYGSTGTAGGGTAIAPYLIAPAPRLSDKYPFDTVMVPTHNVKTGRW
ncbi:MAG: hypothetical protein HKL96_11480 [Phycisphaerales bacterium]|nr:hypothetical protein [Phycisphaerales bacterium]